MPEYKIRIHSEAMDDLQEAIEWYEDQMSGLGSRFKKQVVKQIDKLKATAGIYSIRYGEVRCVVIEKFPFMIHFTIDDNHNHVDILAIFHTSRNPMIWKARH
jgi:plasmid stabilization system protein ParE